MSRQPDGTAGARVLQEPGLDVAPDRIEGSLEAGMNESTRPDSTSRKSTSAEEVPDRLLEPPNGIRGDARLRHLGPAERRDHEVAALGQIALAAGPRDERDLTQASPSKLSAREPFIGVGQQGRLGQPPGVDWLERLRLRSKRVRCPRRRSSPDPGSAGSRCAPSAGESPSSASPSPLRQGSPRPSRVRKSLTRVRQARTSPGNRMWPSWPMGGTSRASRSRPPGRSP